MLSEDVKYRLSIAFASIKDAICTCRDIVIGSPIHSTEKNRILGDLTDVKNVIKQQKFEDVDAIEEAIVALNEAYASTGKLSGGGRIKESLGNILQWLEHIKKTLGYEGLVPSCMEDIQSRSHPIQRTSNSQSNYGYLDDSGAFIPAEFIAGNSHPEYPNYFPQF